MYGQRAPPFLVVVFWGAIIVDAPKPQQTDGSIPEKYIYCRILHRHVHRNALNDVIQPITIDCQRTHRNTLLLGMRVIVAHYQYGHTSSQHSNGHQPGARPPAGFIDL